MVDSASEENLGQIMFFDGEGVVRNTDHELIKNGQFVNLISDLRFGKKFNSPSSGNGIRPYNRGVNLDFRTLKFKKLNRTWNTILKDLPLSIVALVAAGGDSNDLGEYSTPVQIGYVYEHGELVGIAPQITVKTSLDQYLGTNLIDISSDGFISDLPSGCVISKMDVLVN